MAWMVDEKNIEPYVPVWDKTEPKNGSLSISGFQWNEEAQEYRCPLDTPFVASGGPSRTSAHMSRKPTPSSFDSDKPIALYAL